MTDLFILGLVVACISWTVTHEEVFREPREFCKEKCGETRLHWLTRKFFYLFTCEYCFSHWVSLVTVLVTGVKIHVGPDDIRGYILAIFALVAIANVYMTIYFLLRLLVKLVGAKAKRASWN